MNEGDLLVRPPIPCKPRDIWFETTYSGDTINITWILVLVSIWLTVWLEMKSKHLNVNYHSSNLLNYM